MSRSPTLVRVKAALEAWPDPDFAETIGWLDSFESNLAAGDVREKVFGDLVQLGVDHAGTCDCSQDLDLATIASHHLNHGLYNRIVHELLEGYGQLMEMRFVCFRDIKYPDPDPAHPGWGQLVRKDYGQKLLSFLTIHPDPAWMRG